MHTTRQIVPGSRRILPHIASAILLLGAGWCRADSVRLQGTDIPLDDGLFTGCFHDAFEGKVDRLPDGTYKKGEQGIHRTKGVLFGQDTVYGQMACAFTLDQAPAGAVKLIVNGVDDPADWMNAVAVEVNGTPVGAPIVFSNSTERVNVRYLIGWSDVERTIPAGLLKAGRNVLRLANTRPVLTSDGWTFAAVDGARLVFETPVTVTVERQDYPIYYYGLEQGPEVNLWPAVNAENTVTLIQDGEIQYKFYVTLPDALMPQGKPPKGEAPKIMLNLLTDASVTITPVGGTAALAGETTPAGTLYRTPVGRIFSGATPHESQSVSVFLSAQEAFSNKTLTAWCTLAGQDHLKRSYPIRAVALPPLEGRDQLDMLLSIWGGAIPDDPGHAQHYVEMIRRAGFNHMFTSAEAPANALLKQAGFKVYPRFGWFGGKFTVSDATKAWAAVGPDGKPSTKDFCPIAILENWQHPEAGRYYAQARAAAKSPGVDGLCVDFECGAVWCWCDRCVKRFEEETGTHVTDRAELARDGRRYSEYAEAGRRRNRDLLMKLREVMRSENPALHYFSLASACDMPAYWWDGRLGGRFSIREMVKFADEIACSGYFYEVPGGLKSVRPLIEFTRQAAVAAGREVRAGLLSPLATTVGETPRYRGAFMKPDLARLEVLLVAAAGGRQMSFFRGDCFDGSHYVAIREAVDDLLAIRPYLASGLDRSGDLDVRVVNAPPRTVALSLSQNLMTRTAWHPDIWYQYDAIQLLKDALARERLVLLFNYADVPLTLGVKVGGLFDPRFRLTDIKRGTLLGEFSRLDLESGAFTAVVPPRDVLMVRIEAASGQPEDQDGETTGGRRSAVPRDTAP